MADVASGMNTIKTMQAAFATIQLLSLTSIDYPPSCSPTNGSNYDFIIIGSGTGGSVMANRLSANSNVSVLLIEAGDYTPLECNIPGAFTLHPGASYDYNFIAQDDKYSAQNSKYHSIPVTQGKMVGGSSSLNHMMHAHGDPDDYNQWAKMLCDDSWNYINIRPYLKKQEKLVDEGLLASSFADLHGTSGPVKVTRNTNPLNANYMTAYKELGFNVVLDTASDTSILGFAEPLFIIADRTRQNYGLGYLGQAKDRSNLCLKIKSTVTEILIENNAAVGVKVVDANNNTYLFYANKEVIVSAGAINSAKLLMLSGIGPKEHLESLGITVKADLPVGQNLQDHNDVVVLYQMETANASTAASNPYVFPAPTTVGYVALDPSQSYPDYQVINLLFTPNSSPILQLCTNVFMYSDEICQKMYDATDGRNTVMSINNLMRPKSRGKVLLASGNYNDAPLIYVGTFSNSSDLELMKNSLMDFNRIMKTKYFKDVNADLVDFGLCSDASTPEDFWECYALAMSTTLWHYAGTCAMGSVLDSNLCVKGIDNLRVVDSSSMPTEVSGNINAAIAAIAEFAADIILNHYGIIV